MTSAAVSVPAETETPARICIAIPTFRRPELLTRLLDGIAHLSLPTVDGTVDVLVVDNDPDRSAERVVSDARPASPFPLHYAHVATRGLSTVRNYALSLARTTFDLLAMIDDDEVPEPQWLSELVRVQRVTGADAVVGPVPPILPVDAPPWVVEFRTNELPRHGDCSFINEGWSGNCLLHVGKIAAAGLAFDPSLNLAGGEDQLFFRQMLAGGGKIAYAANATAWEEMPLARRSVGFIILRSFRRGNTLAFCDRRLHGSTHVLALRALKGCGLIVLGVAKAMPMTARRGRAALVACSSDVARGAGMLAGLAGFTYRAYR